MNTSQETHMNTSHLQLYNVQMCETIDILIFLNEWLQK